MMAKDGQEWLTMAQALTMVDDGVCIVMADASGAPAWPESVYSTWLLHLRVFWNVQRLARSWLSV